MPIEETDEDDFSKSVRIMSQDEALSIEFSADWSVIRESPEPIVSILVMMNSATGSDVTVSCLVKAEDLRQAVDRVLASVARSRLIVSPRDPKSEH